MLYEADFIEMFIILPFTDFIYSVIAQRTWMIWQIVGEKNKNGIHS